ncbi:hypothetical protein ASPCADRAFT_207714, partial [Aspergillus carbonarius ITEM 5010]
MAYGVLQNPTHLGNRFPPTTQPHTLVRNTAIFSFLSNGGGCLGSMAGGRCARRSSRNCLSSGPFHYVIILISSGAVPPAGYWLEIRLSRAPLISV